MLIQLSLMEKLRGRSICLNQKTSQIKIKNTKYVYLKRPDMVSNKPLMLGAKELLFLKNVYSDIFDENCNLKLVNDNHGEK